MNKKKYAMILNFCPIRNSHNRDLILRVTIPEYSEVYRIFQRMGRPQPKIVNLNKIKAKIIYEEKYRIGSRYYFYQSIYKEIVGKEYNYEKEIYTKL